MKKLTEKKHIYFLVFLCSLIYFTSYISRINFGAVILEIVRTKGFLSSEISLAVTGSFITYGIGQLICGYLCDRFSPKYMLFIGLLVTALMNFLIPFCGAAKYMVIIWSVNGFAQALMWPPISKILATMLTVKSYRMATTRVSWGSSFGTIAVYLIAPIFISLSSWKSMFFVATAACLIMSVVWLLSLNKIENVLRKQTLDITEDTPSELPKVKSALQSVPILIAAVMLAIALQGALRDSVTTWMPTYIAETFNLDSSISILTGVILPVFSIVNLQLAAFVYSKKIKNELSCSGVFFAATFVFALILIFSANRFAALSVLCFAVLNGAAHGVNLMLTCMIVPYFKNPGTMAGALNSCGYVGSALSTYGIALISEKFGWSSTVIVWAVIAFLGTVICFLVAKRWGKVYAFSK